MYKLLYLLLISTLISGCLFAGFPQAKITYHVVDRQGRPIEDALVDVGFIEASGKAVKGYTNTNGIFIATGMSSGSAGALIKKDGYYWDGGGCIFTNINQIRHRFEPWNPKVTVVMREIRNPVPMIYNPLISAAPIFGTPVGFDLEKGDWISPHGSGVRADFVFLFKKIPDVIQGATCEITFSNEYDGLLEYPFDESDHSWFKWPYKAPEKGYMKSWTRYEKYFEAIVDYSKFYPGNDFKDTVTRLEHNRLEDDEINYIFRVRSEVDENGTLVRACYGKIEGEIDISASGGLRFRYWFNPHWTRNLEDDRKKNTELD